LGALFKMVILYEWCRSCLQWQGCLPVSELGTQGGGAWWQDS
jgi:hypothetical protein